MRIESLKLENYKNHKTSSISNCGRLHVLIGRNSAGKTSIFEGIRLVRHLNTGVDAKELVFGGVQGFETKEISLTMTIRIAEEMRREYMDYYLNLKKPSIDELMKTNLLKQALLTFSITTTGEKASPLSFYNHVIIKTVQISDAEQGLLYLQRWKERERELEVKFVVHEQSKNDADKFTIGQYVKGHFEIKNENPLFKPTNMSDLLQYRIIADLQPRINYIGATRESTKRSSAQYVIESTKMGERGANLISLVDTMHANRRKRFDEIVELCKRIFQDIEDIHPQRMPDNSTRIVIKKYNLPYEIDLAQEGSGLDQLLIIIWMIAASSRDTIWLLDEPELHLHPGAQKLLYDFLSDESDNGKQIFVSTHSMVFIHQSPLLDVSLLLDEKGEVRLVSLQDVVKAEEQNTSEGDDNVRTHIYQALGYDPTLSLEPKTVIMVEGRADGNILVSFSNTLGIPISTRSSKFIPFGGKDKVKNFSPILAYAISGKKCMIILDNDNDDPQQTIASIISLERNYVKELKLSNRYLTESNFLFYPTGVYSIEHYLFEPEAICLAAKNDDPQIIQQVKEEVSKAINDILQRKDIPKEALKTIWERRFGPYYEVNTASEIARHISRKHLEQYPELASLIAIIKS